MSALGKKLQAEGEGRIAFFCPGCNRRHTITVEGPHAWGFNGNGDRPTFTPSILFQGVKELTDEQLAIYYRGEPLPEPVPMRCHSFVTDGQIQFLSDCTHSMAGQTVPLADFPRGEE